VKIAIPTNDGINISAHFGRCREFLIFEAQNGQVKLIETRINAVVMDTEPDRAMVAPKITVNPDLSTCCGIVKPSCAAESARARSKRSTRVEYR
jgi:predicted Fe-Mo cluster-binding NifX family protein